jgi:hypothetical protein
VRWQRPRSTSGARGVRGRDGRPTVTLPRPYGPSPLEAPLSRLPRARPLLVSESRARLVIRIVLPAGQAAVGVCVRDAHRPAFALGCWRRQAGLRASRPAGLVQGPPPLRGAAKAERGLTQEQEAQVRRCARPSALDPGWRCGVRLTAFRRCFHHLPHLAPVASPPTRWGGTGRTRPRTASGPTATQSFSSSFRPSSSSSRTRPSSGHHLCVVTRRGAKLPLADRPTAPIPPPPLSSPDQTTSLHYLHLALLPVAVVTLLLFFASGMYSERIGYANRYVGAELRLVDPPSSEATA